MIMISGAVGGFFSMQRRLQVASNSDTYTTLVSLERGGDMAALLSPLSGAIFAVLLSLIFVAKIVVVSGGIFPNIITPEGNAGISFVDFVSKTYPASGTDTAKLLIWSFIAGFAEQTVPDVLNRITNRSQEGGNGPKNPA